MRDAASFRALRRHGRRRRAGTLTVTWLPGLAGAPPRLAFGIPRAVGSAVVRNRLRRRLRAIFAEFAADVPPGTYLIAADPAAATLDYGELRRTVSTALTDLTGMPELTDR